MKATALPGNHVITVMFFTGAIVFLCDDASAQNLYESELYSGAINVIDSSGNLTTFVPSTQPQGEQLAFNSSGDLFVGNNSGPSITEISPNGTASSFGFGFDAPAGVAVNSAGDVFVANLGSGQIIEVSPDGLSETVFASGLDRPYNLAFGPHGDLFETDLSSGNVYEFEPNGGKALRASGFQGPSGLVFNSAGDLFVANSNTGTISESRPPQGQAQFFLVFLTLKVWPSIAQETCLLRTPDPAEKLRK